MLRAQVKELKGAPADQVVRVNRDCSPSIIHSADGTRLMKRGNERMTLDDWHNTKNVIAQASNYDLQGTIPELIFSLIC